MEIVGLFECCGCLLEGGNALGLIVDIALWFGGRPNRVQRKQASQAGQPKPGLDAWNLALIVFTPLLIFFVIVMILKWAR